MSEPHDRDLEGSFDANDPEGAAFAGGFAAGEEGMAGPVGLAVRRRIRPRTLVMGGIVLAAAGSLWSMRIIDRAQAAGPGLGANAEKEILAAIAQGRTQARESDATVLLEFAQEPDGKRLAPERLDRDPFLAWGGAPVAAASSSMPVDDAASVEARWNEAVDGAAATIRILSAMAGARGGVANVNGHMMRPGDVFEVEGVEAEFRIERIAVDGVTVTARDPASGRERTLAVPVARKW